MKLAFGIVLALLSAAAFAASYASQYAALVGEERLELRRPLRSAHMLVSNWRWLLGYAASWGGWGLYVAALTLAPLSLVQAVNAAVIGLLALISHRTVHALSPRERLGTLLAGGGLLLVLATLPARESPHHAALTSVLAVVGAGLMLAVVVVIALPLRLRGAALGVVSGLCYGVGDVATKAAVSGTAVLVPGFLVCVALGFATLQLSYQRTTLLGSAGISSLFTNAIPIVAGVLLYGEAPHGAALVLRCLGFAAVVAGAVALGAEGARETATACSPATEPVVEAS